MESQAMKRVRRRVEEKGGISINKGVERGALKEASNHATATAATVTAATVTAATAQL